MLFVDYMNHGIDPENIIKPLSKRVSYYHIKPRLNPYQESIPMNTSLKLSKNSVLERSIIATHAVEIAVIMLIPTPHFIHL